jgi:predicted amidohydrolase YtcJ
LRKGIQVWTHAIGDRANREILNLYAKAFERVPPDQRKIKEPRWRVEHAQIVAPADIPRFAQLGVIPSMQPSHAIGDLHFAASRLGLKRLEGAYAWQSFIKSGCVVPGGTDAPVERGEPMIEFYAAVARKDLKGFSGEGWHPEQAVTREQALKMFTIWSAYAVFAESERGSIETDKLADLTVLSQDIMKIPEANILQTRCLMTVVNGEIVYDDETRASLSPRRGEGLRVRGEALSGKGAFAFDTISPLTPALSPPRGEGGDHGGPLVPQHIMAGNELLN